MITLLHLLQTYQSQFGAFEGGDSPFLDEEPQTLQNSGNRFYFKIVFSIV